MILMQSLLLLLPQQQQQHYQQHQQQQQWKQIKELNSGLDSNVEITDKSAKSLKHVVAAVKGLKEVINNC